MPVLNAPLLVTHLVAKLLQYHTDCGLTSAQLDLSGGIDSAVMAGLLARAIGPDNVHVLYSSINSSDESRDRAEAVAQKFGLQFCEIDLSGVYDSIVNRLIGSLAYAGRNGDGPMRAPIAHDNRKKDPTIDGSLRSCLRAPVGRYLNRLMGGGIRHGTGNEDEDRWLRFYQKGGDGEVDTNPMAYLSKGEVYQIAVELGVPRSIIEAKPTPDLQGVGEVHNDEEELKALSGVDWTYSKVDPETGKYISVGSIEAMSRILNENIGLGLLPHSVESVLFGRHEPFEGPLRLMHDAARAFHPVFEDWETFQSMALSARKFERATRHKENPNCPTLGSRQEVRDLGLITNTLPQL